MIMKVIVFLSLLSRMLSLDTFDQSGCGLTKSCIRWSSCKFSKCDFAFSWRMIEYQSQKYLEIEILGEMEDQNNGYIALGFSENNNMKGDGVVTCRLQNSMLFISCGYNKPVGRSNNLFSNFSVDSDFLVVSSGSLYGVEFDSKTKMLRCRFLRLMTPNLLKNELKDLNNGSKYNILSSKGVTNSPDALSFHFQNRRISPAKYDLTSSDRVNYVIYINYAMIKIHACLMITGWILFVTNGIFIAYFYKNNCPENTCLRQKLWFQFHRSLLLVGALCIIAAFVIIFVHVGEYSSLEKLPDTAHPILGIIATSLICINPIIAFFRCEPKAESRWIFNVVHFIVGISAFVCAICAMAIGIQMPPAGPNLFNMNAPWICVFVFLCLIIAIFIYGNILKWKRNKTNALTNYDTSLSEKMANTAGYEILFASIIISVVFFITLIVFVVKN